MSSWHLHRVKGEWYGYEGVDEYPGAYASREELEAAIREKQQKAYSDALKAFSLAERNVREAHEALDRPVRIVTRETVGEGES